MICKSCGADIPPAFVYAISINICSGCGGQIMDEESKQLRAELKEAMSKMTNNPDGLAGWLLSNYTLKKIGTAEPTVFHTKQSKQEKRVALSDDTKSEFLKRAGVDKILNKNNPKVNSIIQTINNIGPDPEEDIEEQEENTTEEDLREEMEAEENEQQAIIAAAKAAAAKGRKLSPKEAFAMTQGASMPIVQNSNIDNNDVQSMSQLLAGNKEEELHPILQSSAELLLLSS